MKQTKQHIADKALLLFNDKGFVNVRLQHIADAAFVSIGHLAYHFKNKDAILEYLYEKIKREKGKLLNEHKILPLFEDIDRMLEEIFYHQKKFSFFYTDALEIIRASPTIAKKHKLHIQWQRMKLSFMIEFNTARGAMDIKNTSSESVAKLMQIFIDNWLHSILIEEEGAPLLANFLNDIQSNLLNFTKKNM